MSLSLKVLKFIHLGNEFPFYVDRAVQLSIPEKLLTVDEAKVLTRSECVQVLDVIKKSIITSKSVPRIDETLILINFILKYLTDPDLRSLIYEALCEILITFHDLTLFLLYKNKFANAEEKVDLNTLTNGDTTPQTPKTHFSSGLKSFLQKWYDKQSLENLTDMIGEHRKLNGWRHRDIIALGHIKFTDEAKKRVVDVTFQRGSKFVSEATGNEDVVIKKLVDICRVRMSEDPTEISELVAKHKLRFEHLPSALYKTPEIWEKCLPVLSYSALLNCMHILQDLNLLTPQQGLAKKVGFAIGNPKTLKEAKLHPFHLYTELQLYENNERYTENVHEKHRAKKVAKLKLSPNKEIIKKLRTAFEQSFDHYPATGMRLIITLDNRHGMYTKKVLSKNLSKYISCFEASLIIALTYLKRERDVKILTYTDDPEGEGGGGIETLALQRSMSFEDALQFCKTRQRTKTLNSLELPFNFARNKGYKADVFITITDSVIRNAPLNKPPTQAINAYKKGVNIANVRHVVLGLANPKRAFETLGPEEGRILEITGFTSNTAKVMDEFIKRTF